LLDLGAGKGTISQLFLEKGYEVYAMEWTSTGVKKLVEMGVSTLQKDSEDLPYIYEDNFFDEVFWGDNIEHLFFQKRFLKKFK
jgi:2-polyprenyl-3-methyl-5-hydroxy-6-metoxy-1,4-benzoquinol methylase